MCIRFAELERKLGEIDRARAVYMHASQMADPRVSAATFYWKCNQATRVVARLRVTLLLIKIGNYSAGPRADLYVKNSRWHLSPMSCEPQLTALGLQRKILMLLVVIVDNKSRS